MTSNSKFDKIIARENGGPHDRTNTPDFISSAAKTLPPMLHVMKDIGGIELPESMIKLAGEGTRDNKEEANGEAVSQSSDV